MKNYTLLIALFFATQISYSQTSVSGYYINNNKDTIAAEFKIQKGVFGQITNNFTDEIFVLADEKKEKLTPNDIEEYYFTYNNTLYRFFSKPIKNGSKKFLSALVTGPKTSLYLYGNFVQGNGNALSSNQTFYTFEKADGTYLFLRNILNKKFKADLKNFYQNNLEAQKLIDEKIKYWLDLNNDLIFILNQINKN